MGLFSAIRALFGGGPGRDGGLAPAAFTEEMARRVRAAAPEVRVHVPGELELEIASGADGGGRVFLSNAYRMYRGLPAAEREEMMARFVRSFADATRGFEPTRDAIIPIVKDRAWLAEVEAAVRAQGGESQDKVFEPLNDALAVVYAIDTPNNIAYLSPGMLDSLGVDRAGLRALAVRNLRGLLPGIDCSAARSSAWSSPTAITRPRCCCSTTCGRARANACAARRSPRCPRATCCCSPTAPMPRPSRSCRISRRRCTPKPPMP